MISQDAADDHDSPLEGLIPQLERILLKMKDLSHQRRIRRGFPVYPWR